MGMVRWKAINFNVIEILLKYNFIIQKWTGFAFCPSRLTYQ